ncbi:Ig-like domain-containing protein [Enterococcus moraviensis]|uniref:Ig-like domain-containing protein n=1 Tax=Enterococcus moraviensis TaxID=155617 RepID=UPI00201021F4
MKNAGGAVIGSGVANGSGDFTVILLPGIATPNETLNAIASDGNGNESDPTSFTTPADAVIVPAPTVSNVTGNSATGYAVTGTATPGDNVVVKNASGIIIAAGIADPLGNFTAVIPIGLASPSEELNAIAVSGLNQSSATPFETPADAVVVPAPVVTGVTGNSSAGYTVTGTATPGDTVTVKNSGGTVLASGTADPLGQFSINLPIGSATPLESLNAIAFDGLGNQSSATPFITPPDLVIVAPPTVEGVTGSSASGYTVTGKATPGNLISIKNTGGTVIATAQADLLGNYTAVIPTGQATPNEQLKAIASDILGNQSIATNFNTPADPVLVGSPVITNVTGTSTTGYSVTGTATPGDTVLVKNTGGTIIGTGTTDSSGNFTVVIPVGSAMPSQQLSAIADDGNGHQSLATPFMTPSDPVVVGSPIVTGVTGSSSTGYTVTGTATPGDTITITNTGGTIIGTGVADSNGDFTVTVPAGSAAPNQQLTATAQDANGNTSPGTNFTTPADPVIVPAPVVTEVTGSSATGYTVKGSAVAGNTVLIKNTGGTIIASGIADSNGNFTATIPVGLATPSQQLTATAQDPDGNTSPGTSFITPADPVIVTAPTVTGVTGSSASGYVVTGSATAGDSILIKNTGGTVIGTATADPNGSFTVTIPIGLASPNEQLNAIADDGDGHQSSATPFTTPADSVVVNAPVVTGVTGSSNTGYTVTGTATPGDTVSIKNTGGTVVGSAVADQNGDFTVIIPVGSATPNQQLTATAQDPNGNTSPGTSFVTPADPVVVTAPTVSSVTGTAATGYTVNGTADAGNTVIIKNTGGTIIGTATADQNGNFTVLIPINLASSNELLVAVAEDGNGHQSSATPFTTPADPVSVTAPTVTNVTGSSSTGYTVTGTADAGDTVAITNTGGNDLGSATVDPSGKFSIVIQAGLVTPSEQLKATASDAAGNQSSATPFTTPADPVVIPAPIVTSVTGNSSTGYTVKGTAKAGDTLLIKKLTGTEIGATTVDENGNYTVILPAGAALAREQLRAIDSDGAGHQSPATSFITPADPVVVASPIITSVTGNSSTGYTVKGTATPANSISLRTLSGAEVGTGSVDPNGDFTIELEGQEVNPLQQLHAIAIDDELNMSLPTLFTIPANPSSSIEAPTIENVTGTSKAGYIVTGKTTAGHKVKIRNAAGRVIGSGIADSNGQYSLIDSQSALAPDRDFSIALPTGSATEKEALTATAENNIGDVSTATPFMTPADPTVYVATPIVDSVTGNSMTGYTIKGIATPGNDVEIQNENGEMLAGAKASDNGLFVITIPIGFAEPQQLVSAIAKDEQGNKSEPAKFKLPADPDAGNGNNNGAGNGSNLGNNGSSGFNNLNSSQKNLPNNGEVFSNWGILGALLLGVFSFFTFKRTHKKEDE